MVSHKAEKGAGRGGWESDWGKVSDLYQTEIGEKRGIKNQETRR